jgi:hypothetical protein
LFSVGVAGSCSSGGTATLNSSDNFASTISISIWRRAPRRHFPGGLILRRSRDCRVEAHPRRRKLIIAGPTAWRASFAGSRLRNQRAWTPPSCGPSSVRSLARCCRWTPDRETFRSSGVLGAPFPGALQFPPQIASEPSGMAASIVRSKIAARGMSIP